MKNLIVTILCVLITSIASGQNTIIPSGTTILVDGHFSIQEWSDAQQIVFPISPGVSSKVYLKHDAANLYIAFAGNLQSGGFFFPELMIDANYSRSLSLEQDDWWFHVSATDCEYQGAYGNYANCQLTRPNWTAVPNFQTGVVLDTVEIKIPLSTIMVNSFDTIGIAFLLNNFQIIKSLPGTANHLNPSTWLSAILDVSTKTSENEKKIQNLTVFPNPSQDWIQFELDEDMNRMYLFDLLGNQVMAKKIEIGLSKQRIDLSAFADGIYFLKVTGEKKTYTSKIIKN